MALESQSRQLTLVAQIERRREGVGPGSTAKASTLDRHGGESTEIEHGIGARETREAVLAGCARGGGHSERWAGDQG